MPEIKNTFSQGKMNKDLDERLIQNGSYRDALNVDVTSSEESNAGTVQNILGNTSIEGLIGGLNGYTCVGSVPDETTNKLYWLVSGIDKDAIVEYDASSSISRFIAVDISKSNNEFEAFLNFSGSYISGINIIDEFLFWTDGENEPKRINVRNSSQQDPLLNINEQDHARLFVDENDIGPLQTEHVTVVKRKPSTAPFIELKNLEYSSQEPIFEKILPRFCFRYKYKDGEYSAFGPFTEVAFNPEYQDGISSNNAYFTDEPYNKAMSNFISSVCIYDFVPCDIPEDVVQVDILYKQENSNVVYSIANIKKDSEEWNELGSSQLYESENTQSTSQGKYIITSESIHAALPSNQLLRPWDNVPKKALSQEIIGNRVVYGNYSQGYDLETKPKLLSDFEYRGLQNFTQGGLRTLKSQRDYQVGVVVGDEYGRETPVFTSTEGSVRIQWSDPELGKNASNSLMFKSSLQDYLPEWASYYKFYVKETSSEYYNLIMDKAYIPPKHVDYKNTDDHVWISFPSSDRNKIMEDDFIIAKKAYNNSDPTQVAYENKFQVLDIKNEAPDAVRYVFTNLGIVTNPAEGESGEGPVTIPFDPNDDEGTPLFPEQDKSINAETDIIYLQKTRWFQIGGAPLVAEESANEENDAGVLLTFADTLVKDVYLSWELPDDTGETSNISTRYKVSSVRISNGNVYVLKLSEKISADGKALADNWPTGLKFKIERRDRRNPEDFSGKFFVKIKSDDSFTSVQSSGIIALESAQSFWLYDTHNADGDSELDGIVNSNTSTVTPPSNDTQVELASNYSATDDADDSVTGLNTPSEWQDLINSFSTLETPPETIGTTGGVFFIDNLRFVASNPSGSNFAKESGEGWFGATTIYDKFHWGGIQTPAAEDIFDTDAVVYGWGTGQDSLTNASAQGEFANFTTSFGGHGLGPRIQSTSLANSNTINGLEGVVTSTNQHVFGARQWLRSSIYERYLTDNAYSAEGKYYIHLSFLAPGVDLHDGTWTIPDPNVWGSRSHARDMQGIWGGGIFTKTPTSANMNEGGFTAVPSWANSSQMQPPAPPAFGSNPINWVEFEGSYDSTGEFGIALETSPEDQGAAGGYNSHYADQHFNQWNPAYLEGGLEDQNVANFVDQIQAGNQFVFAGDTTNEVYSILDVTEVKLYNHTPWRMKWMWNGTEYVAGGNSVEEAASAWADTWSSSGNAAGEADALATLRERIKHFGQANNRRICYVIEVDKDPTMQTYNIADDASGVHAANPTRIQFIDTSVPSLNDTVLSYPTIWETEPSQVEELNIYHEASSNIPTRITGQDREIFAPIGCEVKLIALPNANNELGIPDEDAVGTLNPSDIPQDMRIISWNEGQSFTIEPGLPQENIQGNPANYNGALFKFIRNDNSYTIGRIDMPIDNWSDYIDGLEDDNVITEFTISEINDVTLDVGLNWYNAFSFGDGVESNRIRDAFNEMRITNGARVSATLEEPYSEENRKSGLIYSGIYNSDSGVNNLNQFIQAEKITKDLNPTYGSIQKLFSRNTDLVALCEDRILKILANKDALFNADGNPQLVATERVLGQAVPFVGDYGISQNPESFAYDSYRAYFTDKQRGAVLRLSMDGLTPISDAGMRDWFRDNLRDDADLLGTYDGYSKHYNITIKPRPYDNIIQNSSISGGTELEQLPAPDDIIINGSLAQGGSSIEPTTLAELFVDQPNINVPVFNRELNSVTEVQHYHPIPLGSLNNVFDVVVGQTGVDATNADFAIIPYTTSGDAWQILHYQGNNHNLFNSNTGVNGAYYTRFTYSDDLGTLANPIDPNNLSLGTQLGNISDTVPGDGNTEDVNTYDSGSAYPSIFAENGDQVEAGLYPTVYDAATPNGGITFRGTPDNNGRFGYIVTNYVQGFDTNNNVPDGISEWAAEQNEIVNNNTMLNGEEIYISFNVRYNHHGINPTDIIITLLDGAGDTVNNVVDSSLIIEPGNLYDQSDPSTYWTNQAFDFDEQLPAGFAADVNNPNVFNRKGFMSVSEVEFPGISAGALSNNFNHSVFFKFSNGTEDTSVVVQDLKVKIEVRTAVLGQSAESDLEDFTELVIMNLKVLKAFKQNKANTPAIPAIEAQNPFPSENIPGWARVVHYDPDYWSTANADLLVQNVNLYGDTTPLFENTDPATGLSYFVPAPQSGINILGEPFPQYDASFDTGQGNVFDSQFIDVDGHAYLQPNDSITHIFQNEFSFQQDRWYAIDIKGMQASALSTGPTEFALDNFSTYYPDLPTSELVLINQDNGGAYEAEETTSGYERHRIIFKASSNGLQIPNAFNLLDPENVSKIVIRNVGNNNRAIGSVTVFDITDEVEPGFAEDWYITSGQQYFDSQNILQEPNFTYGPVTPNTSQNYIAWNGEIPNTQAFAQDFEVSPQATDDGYEFNFKIFSSDGASTNIHDALQFSVFNNEGQGFLCGIDFDNLNVNGIHVKIKFNFDSSMPEVLADLPNTPSGVFESINNAVMLLQNSGPTSLWGKVKFMNVGLLNAGVYNISLQDITEYFIASTIPNWVIPEGQEFITYDDSYGGQISFNECPEDVIVYQSIQLQPGFSYTLSYDHNITEGSICGYYWSIGSGYTTFEILPNSPNSQIITINSGFPEAGEIPSNFELQLPQTNALVFYSCEGNLTGTLDNITLVRRATLFAPTTVSFNEDVRGWVSFKSFIPESGLSVSNQYYTMFNGGLYQHNTGNARNRFYDMVYPSTVTTVLNMDPSLVKSFKTINYEGSQARVRPYVEITNADGDVVNNLSAYNAFTGAPEPGWYTESIITDLQEGYISEFIKKEGKWFNYIKGLNSGIETKDLNFQGLGVAQSIDYPE